MYTIHNNKLIKLFKDCSFGERSRLHILSNRGKIKFLTEGSSSAFSSEFEILLLDPKTDSLVSDIAYYYDENGPWEYNSNPYVYTDKKSFNSLLNDFMECSIFDRLEWNIIDEKTVLY